MTAKNRIIIILLLIAIASYCVIQFEVLPARERKQAEYLQNQTDALTHDISVVKAFKSPYIGDASNVGNLFGRLPLCDVSMKFSIDSDNCTLTVSYMDVVQNIGEDKVKRDVVYNSLAAMAAIDNLRSVTCEFTGDSFTISRDQAQIILGELSELLENGLWNEKVQNQLNSFEFVEKFFNYQ